MAFFPGVPAINDSGAVVYLAFANEGATMELRHLDRGVLTAAPTLTRLPTLNSAGDVVIGVGGDDPPQALVRYRAATETLETIVETGATFTRLWHPFFHGGFGFNDSGQVAFFAELPDGSAGIFTGPDPHLDVVVLVPGGAGQLSLFLGRDSLNSFGEIAYWHNGRIMLASPDVDRDRVADVRDLCPATVWPEAIPTRQLRPEHYALRTGTGSLIPAGSPANPVRAAIRSPTRGAVVVRKLLRPWISATVHHERFGCSADRHAPVGALAATDGDGAGSEERVAGRGNASFLLQSLGCFFT